jgi:hypothetical protein
VRNGNVAVDQNNILHLTWRRHPGAGGDPRKGLWSKTYNPSSGSFTAETKVTPSAASDFSDVAISPADKPYIMGEVAGAAGLWYLASATNPASGEAIQLFENEPRINNISDPDHINVDLEFDKLNRQFTVFNAAGSSSPASRPGYYLMTAAGQDITNSTALKRITPEKSERNEGGKDSNPLIATAGNQGVFATWGDEVEGKVYVRGIGGAEIGMTGQGGGLLPDFNCDGQVNIQDFGILLSHWNKTTAQGISQYKHPQCSAKKTLDLKTDGVIDALDMSILLSCWGRPNPQTQPACFGSGPPGSSNGGSAQCGNGVLDSDEQCDGTNLNGQTCTSLGYDSGTLACNSSCQYDTSNCQTTVVTCPITGKEIVAKSGSRPDVQAAVDAAGSGDTVRIPAGSFSYGDEEVVINKSNITITGTGNQETILHRDVDAGWVGIFRIRGGNNITIQNLQLFGLNSASASEDDFGIYVSGDVKNLRITNSRFQYMSRGIAIEGANATGVIDHNKFFDIYRPAIANLGYGIAPVARTWTQDIQWGGPDALFIEDNEFYNMRHAVSAGSGMYYVFRHNHTTKNFPKEKENDICWGDQMTGDCYYKGWQAVDSHGGGYSDDFGTRAAEIYENIIETEIQNDASGAGIYIRGGDALIFNNTIKLNYNDGITLMIEGGTDPTSIYQIHDTYIWNNTIDLPGQDIVNEDPGDIKEGRDYHLSPKPGYTPYTYPHPLTQCQTN